MYTHIHMCVYIYIYIYIYMYYLRHAVQPLSRPEVLLLAGSECVVQVKLIRKISLMRKIDKENKEINK